MNGHPPRPGASRRAEQRRRRTAPLFLLVVTLGTAAALGMVLYIVSTSLPFLVASPTTDARFGLANQCLMGALSGPRVGFAVSWDGGSVAGYSGAELALCGAAGGGRTLSIRGVQQAAWDEQGTLWLGTSQVADAGWRLWRLEADGGLASAGDFAPRALAGHARGAVALDASGRLVSLTREGDVLGWAQLPAAPVGPVQLTVNGDGTVAAVVAGGGVFAYRTADLSPLRAEAPCEAEFLWWLPHGDGAVLSCGPDADFGLTLQMTSGEREAAPRKVRIHSVLVPGLGVYAQSCEQLPCTAQPP